SEIGSRREQHDRLLFAELMREHAREPRIRALRHSRRDDRGFAFLGVVMNEEMLGLEHLPLEPVVLDLILAEVVLRGGATTGHADGEREREAGDESRPVAPRQRHAPAAWPLSSGTCSASAQSRSN